MTLLYQCESSDIMNISAIRIFEWIFKSIAKTMRYLFIILIFVFGCQSKSKKFQKQIFDESLLLHLMSWSEAMGKNYVPEFYYKPGDSVKLESKLSLLIIPSDTIVEIPLYHDAGIELDSGVIINIRRTMKNSTEIEVMLNDSTYRGIIDNGSFLDAQWGADHLNQERTRLIENFVLQKKECVKELAVKYQITEDSVLHLISREYYERTGGRGINY